MLKFKSFAISDADGINTLLSNYRIADGASVFVSNGEILVPYEDGEPMNNAQKAIAYKEESNKYLQQIDIIEHSQTVLDTLIADANERVSEAKRELNALDKKDNHNRDIAKQKVKESENALSQLESQKIQNDVEVRRLRLNVDIFAERIAKLG